MKISNNTWDWLGDGIYFWQNNYERAWHYANNPPGGLKIKKPAVLDKEIPKNINPAGDLKSTDNVIRRLDCSVIKQVHEYFHSTGQPPFDSVRAMFIEGDRLYKGAGFMEKNHIQVAIRNPNMIKGYFLPRKEIYWSGAPLPFIKKQKAPVTRGL